MAFTKLSEILKKWAKKKNVNFLLEKEKTLEKLNRFLWEKKGYNEKEVKAIDLYHQNLKIQCGNSVLSFQLRQQESEIKNYLLKNFNLKVKKIFYQIF
ncbi:MAG: hypothetical protein AB7D02_01045 [Candidatus Paceibacterota bacterium]